MADKEPYILILSTSLFTDRILLYSSFASAILPKARVIVWTSSFPANEDVWRKMGFEIKPFPDVINFRESLNVMREVCNSSWAEALPAPSLQSMRRHNKEQWKKRKGKSYTDHLPLVGYALGKAVAAIRAYEVFEKWLMKKLARANRSIEAYTRLQADRPDLLVSTNPMWMYESGICVEAKKLGIPVFAFIPSWDNITTKSRFTFQPDFYAVWSDIRKKELSKYYPYSRPKPVYSVGAPQYDVFYRSEYRNTKQEFFEFYGLNPNLPLVLVGLGSPYFIKSEFPTTLDLLRIMRERGMLEKVQFLIRPHPNKENPQMFDEVINFHPNVKVQDSGFADLPTVKRSQNEMHIKDWVNTILHCDLILNMTSTILLDGTLFDKPSVNVAFDSQPGGEFNAFLKEIVFTWPHVNSVYTSGGSVYTFNMEDTISAIFNELEHPEERRKLRKALRQQVLFNEDGQAGIRLAQAILDSVPVSTHAFSRGATQPGTPEIASPGS